MNESEYIDVLIGVSNHNFIVQPKQFNKGSESAEEAKKTMAVLAYKSVQEGYGIYRQVGDRLFQLNVDEEYPMIAKIERIVAEQNGYARTSHDEARIERGKALSEALSYQGRMDREAIDNRRRSRYESMIEEDEAAENSNTIARRY